MGERPPRRSLEVEERARGKVKGRGAAEKVSNPRSKEEGGGREEEGGEDKRREGDG